MSRHTILNFDAILHRQTRQGIALKLTGIEVHTNSAPKTDSNIIRAPKHTNRRFSLPQTVPLYIKCPLRIADTELNEFRLEVVLHINKKSRPVLFPQFW